jgi:hypothetical protein
MGFNCFSCPGVNQECVNERRYVPYGDNDSCLKKAIAERDEARLRIGEVESIRLENRQMFLDYLQSKDEKEMAKRLSISP